MEKVDNGMEDYTEVEDMVMDVVMDVVAKEDMVEGSMVLTHMSFLEGTKRLWHKLLYNLHING